MVIVIMTIVIVFITNMRYQESYFSLSLFVIIITIMFIIFKSLSLVHYHSVYCLAGYQKSFSVVLRPARAFPRSLLSGGPCPALPFCPAPILVLLLLWPFLSRSNPILLSFLPRVVVAVMAVVIARPGLERDYNGARTGLERD